MSRPDRASVEARIAAGLATLGLGPPPGAAGAMAEHMELVAEWNRLCNLTAVHDPSQMVSRHVLDSAAVLPMLRGRRMLDAGSGAGFPGVVLALLAPGTVWVLAESNGKKARFLDHALRRLALAERVSTHHGRLEGYRRQPGFDTVTARALADLATLVTWTAPLLAPGGRLVALKGRRREIEGELAAIAPGWRSEITPLAVPGEAAERHAVVLERETD